MRNDRKTPASRRPTTRPPTGRAAAPSRPPSPSPTASTDSSHLRAIVELAEDAVYVKDRRLRYLLVNPAAAKYLGVPAAMLIGRTDAQVFGPAKSRETDAIDRRVLRRKEAVTYERRGLSAGNERVFLTTKVPYRSPRGELLGLIGISREITGRKRAEEALARSETKHRLLLDGIQSPVLALDERLRVVYCNKAYAEFVGRPRTEIEGRDLLRAFPRLRHSKTLAAYRQVLADGRGRTVEGAMGDRVIEARVTRTPGGLLAIAEDVTAQRRATKELERARAELEATVQRRSGSLARSNRELQQEAGHRRRVEQTLRDSEAKYRAILENSQDIITILNEDGVVKYANPALTGVLGHAVGEVLGKSVLEYLHPSDAPGVIKLLGELHQQPGAAAKTEVRLRHADGGWRLLEVSSKHIPQSRLLGGVVINARDITEGRRAQDEARETEDRQRLLFELAPDAYFLCDFKGRLADCNRAFEQLAGAGREALVGKSLWDLNLLPIDQAPELTALLARNALGEEAGPEEFTLSGGDGRAFRAEIKTHPVKIKGQPLVLGVVADVTATARERDHEQEHYRGLEFLARAANQFVKLDPAQDLAGIIADQLSGWLGGAMVGVLLYDAEAKAFRPRAVAGLGPVRAAVEQLLGLDLLQQAFPALDDEIRRDMLAARLVRLKDGVYELFFRTLPRAVCRAVETQFAVSEVHAMGLVANDTLLGSVSIVLRDGQALTSPAVIETFVNLAAVAVERRLDEEKLRRDIVERERSAETLRKSEEFSRAVIDHSPLGISVRNSGGELLTCNAAWKRIWGISDQALIDDIISRRAGPSQEHDPALLRGWWPAVQRVYREGGTLSVPELALPGAPPPGRWLALHYNALLDDTGAVERVIIVTEDISERRAGEDRLKRSEQHFRALIERSSEVITIVDRDGVIRYKSPSVTNELGYDPAALVGTAVFDHIHPDDAPALRKSFKGILKTPGARGAVEFRFRHRDGRWVTLSAVGQNLLKDPAVAGVVINSRNVTERKQAEQALRELNQRFEYALGATHTGFDIIDADYNVIYVDPEWKKTYGEPAGRKCHEYFMGRAEVCPGCGIAAALRDQATTVTEEFLEREQRWVEVHTIPFQGEDGTWLVAEFNIDINERKKAEQTLRESEQRYRTLSETSPDLIFTVDRAGTVQYANEACGRAIGRRPSEFIGQRVDAIFGGETARRQGQNLRRVFESGEPLFVEGESQFPSGPRWLETWLVPLKGGSGEVASVQGVSRDITERKSVARELQESEAKYRTLFDQASDGIMLMAVDGSSRMFNESFARMHGYGSPAEMERLRLEDIDTPETAQLAPERLRRMLAGETLRFEVEHRHKDGRTIALQVSCSVIRIGERPFFLGFHQDITEHRSAARALRETEQRYRNLVENMADGVYRTSAEGRFLEVNQAMVRIFRYGSREEMLSADIPRDLYFSEADRFRNYPAPGTDRTRVLRMKRRDGSEVWVEDNCRYIRDEHGEVAVHEGVLRDITERVRAEATLRESEERYRALAEALPDIVFVIDARGGIQYANALAASLVGLTPAQVREHRIDEFFPEHINERQREQLARVFQSGETVHLELQTPLNGALRWLESWLVPMRDPGGRIGSVMGISRDITARKQTEQALLEDEERYRTALDSMLDAVHVVDRDLRIVLINAAFLEWLRRLGLDSDVVGRTIFEAFPFLPPAVGDEYRRVFETGGPTSTEETTEVGGSRLTTATRKIPVEIGGRVERVLTVIRDITERVQREQALRQLSVRQEALLSAIPDIVMEVDAAKVYRWANPAGIEFFGDDVLGREAAHYFEGEQQTYEAVRPLFDGDESVVYVESWQRRRDGEKRLLAWWSRVLKDDQGTVTGALSSARDITERRQAEERVKYLTYHDRLTGLANRACFEERIREYDRPEHHPLSLVMGDANGLKLVNDAFGHDAGDKFLQRLAAIIESCARPGDQVFRWGGDEFVVLMPRTGNDAARAVCDAIHRACGEAPEDPIQPSIALGAGTKASPDQPVNLMMMEAEDRMYRHKLVESKSLRSSIISSLGRTLWEADYETEEHALRLQALAREFGRSLKLTDSEMNDLMMLAALHDIGKIAIADGILLKPTVLSESEWEAVRKHPEIGFRIAQASPELAPIADGILHHHERWDGSGYPQGLQGERIPMIARILAIIDAYDVMTEKRLYKTTVSKEAAIAELERCAGSQFDPELVNLFVKIISRR